MRRLYNVLLTLMALACLPQQSLAAEVRQGRYSIIEDPKDQRPNAVTRPANAGDRAWRKGRRSPEIVNAPRSQNRAVRPFEAPRYDARGRRLNVPGRPDTYDQFGRAGATRRPVVVPSGPRVRTDAASRINQLAR